MCLSIYIYNIKLDIMYHPYKPWRRTKPSPPARTRQKRPKPEPRTYGPKRPKELRVYLDPK